MLIGVTTNLIFNFSTAKRLYCHPWLHLAPSCLLPELVWLHLDGQLGMAGGRPYGLRVLPRFLKRFSDHVCLGLGACQSDDMGPGKTAQRIAALLADPLAAGAGRLRPDLEGVPPPRTGTAPHSAPSSP
jgi:hypothetical protein